MFQLRKTDIFLLALLAMTWWITFLFVDAFSYQKINQDIDKLHFSATENAPKDIHTSLQESEKHAISQDKKNTIPLDSFGIQEELLKNKTQEDIATQLHMNKKDILSNRISQLKINSAISIFEDIKVLEKLYKKQKNPLVLKSLIEKLQQDYQFDKAKKYIDIFISEFWQKDIDPHLYLNILFNSSSISVMKASSIEQMRPKVEEARIKWLLSTDDYLFYQALFDLRYRDYDAAMTLLKQIKTPRYTSFIEGMTTIDLQIKQQRDVPVYYKDALIALNLLKHGYFSLAKKISLDVLAQNDSYILPYQILAYSHFLTNDWNTAIDYFLKLSDFDAKNKSLYKFLLWVSYYRLGKYEPSVLYLSQIEQTSLESPSGATSVKMLLPDSYRYLLLNYLAMGDKERMISTRKKFLWQVNLQKSDFYTFFYEVLYRPFIEWKDYDLYKADPQLTNDYVSRCKTVLVKADEDVCMYGHAWLLFSLGQQEQAKSELLYLAKNYPQSYIFRSLWDYYYQANDLGKAKQYYIKAISMPHSDYEEVALKTKLTEFATMF